LIGDRLANEDYYAFRQLFQEGLGSNRYDLADKRLGGGDVVAQVGIASGSDLQQLGAGDAILVAASDLHQEGPVWWLRVKQAAERGATLVVLNGRATRLDASATLVHQYAPGRALATVRTLLNAAKVMDAPEEDVLHQAGQALANANNLVIFYGSDGLSYEQSQALARMLGNLLLLSEGDSQHAGRVNNGLIPVWPRNNTQGAWDIGITGSVSPDIYGGIRSGETRALYAVGADPIGDGYLQGRGDLEFLVVQELFLTETAQAADVVLPAQSWAEREGTFTTGERRVQRFYMAITPVGNSRDDWRILGQVGEKLGMSTPKFAASLVFGLLAKDVPVYEGMTYRTLAHVEEQWPKVGGDDLYYGGTSYNNQSGLGQQWPAAAESGPVSAFDMPAVDESSPQIVQARTLYRPSTLVDKSEVIAVRVPEPGVWVHPAEADALAVAVGDSLVLKVNGRIITTQVQLNEDVLPGQVVVQGVPFHAGEFEIGEAEPA
jgi:NADH-quinone oxidoreductase subunit G